ncbi:uncharacterized protein [Macrobrachium rosenbergii]|uniref:uncharacterized protein n=1 Tax=Macrobrachium rosenbergii TaxID=79674 RepID=UPI0034D66D12
MIIYSDGKLLVAGNLTGTNGIIPLNGSLYIGQDQDRFNGGTDPTQTISGYVAQMNIWNYALNENTIRDIASCAINLRGNVVSTDVTEFNTPGVDKYIVPVTSLCIDEPAYVIVPMERYILSEAIVFCNLVHTSVFIPPNAELNTRLFEDSFQFRNACDSKSYRRLLLGATDDLTEGIWRNVKTGEPITYSAWGPGEPNSGANANCVVLRNDMPFWGDQGCEGAHCFPCGRTANDFVYLRGLCRPVEHQILFIIDGYVNNRPYFRGYYGMAMFSTGGTSWLFKDTMVNMTIATTHLHNPEDYPIGRTQWDVVSPFCTFAPGEKMELGLSACTTKQYMCSDGSCVARDVRCNLREDCADGSDEKDCGIIAFTGRYASHRPPPGQTFKDKLLIFPHVHLIRFSKIDDISLAFYMEYEVYLAWTDRNLKFKNIKDEEAKNKLSNSEVESIWTPEVDFLNVNDGLLKKLKSGVYARKTGDPDPPLFNDVKMENHRAFMELEQAAGLTGLDFTKWVKEQLDDLAKQVKKERLERRNYEAEQRNYEAERRSEEQQRQLEDEREERRRQHELACKESELALKEKELELERRRIANVEAMATHQASNPTPAAPNAPISGINSLVPKWTEDEPEAYQAQGHDTLGHGTPPPWRGEWNSAQSGLPVGSGPPLGKPFTNGTSQPCYLLHGGPDYTIYQSQNVSLVQKNFYSGSFSCNFGLFKYPFDTQVCSVLIKLDSADTSVITFSNATVEYSGLINLPKYAVHNIVVELSERVGYAVMEVKFQLKRRWSLLVLTIFIPTLLLICIGYVTLFIKLQAFQVRAVMTLTTLLVLYTLFNQVSSNLPDTAYIKMIDIWFFFCIFLIFSVIIVHIAVEHLPADGDNIMKVKSGSRVSPVWEPPTFQEKW